jgi:hypothetical protein
MIYNNDTHNSGGRGSLTGSHWSDTFVKMKIDKNMPLYAIDYIKSALNAYNIIKDIDESFQIQYAVNVQ